jgi:hypothetical protein
VAHKDCKCGHCDIYAKVGDLKTCIATLLDGAQNRLTMAEHDLELLKADIHELNGRISAYQICMEALDQGDVQTHLLRVPPKAKPDPKAKP